jgi:ketohexokinase
MAKILAVGIATLDIINTVANYPCENDEVRVLAQQRLRGGNATNTLTVLSQLGHQCSWAGNIVDESDKAIIDEDLATHHINTDACHIISAGKNPTSYITLNQKTGSRTIVHHRDCPEYSFEHFQQIDLNDFEWIHFEGRNIEQTLLMLQWLKQHHPQIPCSLEIEKPRTDISSLFPFADLLMFSQQYAEAQGFDSASQFLDSLNLEQLLSCTWGEQGAVAKLQDSTYTSPAFPPEQVIDTLGAGDTFNAALIDALSRQLQISEALIYACKLAGKKCGQSGLNNLLENA